jgi:hypothetical protein
VSPYARFNLRRNPFGELTREERAELAVVDVQQCLSALQHRDTALQFIGESGRGKTTHLLALEQMLPHAAYIYLPEDAPAPVLPDVRPLLLDEAQRLSARQRRSLFRRGGPLVLGTHEDLTVDLHRFAFQVLTVDVAAEQSPDRLARILNSRIEASRLSGAAIPRFECQYARTLQRRLGSNIRAIELYLYDEFQDAVRKGLPWPPVN